MPSTETQSELTTSDETRNSEGKDYEGPSADQGGGSVFDFLYQDVRRVGSFLAQFEEYGVRQSVKATEAVGQTQTIKGTASGTLGLPAVFGGSAAVDATTADETKDLAEHTFDPLWANARRFLDYIELGTNLQTNLWEANIGSFVKISGSISVVDLQHIKTIFDSPSINKSFMDEFLEENNLQEGSRQAIELERNIKLVAAMPHGLQLAFYSNKSDDGVQAWSSISHESLTTSAADLILKHGVIITGFWTVIGILDAYPDMLLPTEENPNPQTMDEIGVDALPKDLTKLAARLASTTRELIGRPRTHFGITPILIFRQVDREE